MPSERARLGFLHTAAGHEASFEKLIAGSGLRVETRHVVAASLLERVRSEGLSAEVERAIGQGIEELVDAGCGLVICTCSTLGDAAERLGEGLGHKVWRVDRPMAAAAGQLGQRPLLVAALASTLEPSLALLRAAGEEARRRVEPIPLLVEDAWQHFERGEHDLYVEAIVRAVRDHLARKPREVDVVVLAQASMAPAAPRLADAGLPVLTSPATLLLALRRHLAG